MILNDLFLLVAEESLLYAKDKSDLIRILNELLKKIDKDVFVYIKDKSEKIYYTNKPDNTNYKLKTKYFIDLKNENEETITLHAVFNEEFNKKTDEEYTKRLNGFLNQFRMIYAIYAEKLRLKNLNIEFLKLYKFIEHISLSLELEQLRRAIVSGIFDMIDSSSISFIYLDRDSRDIFIISKAGKEEDFSEFNINVDKIKEYSAKETENESDFVILKNWVKNFWAITDKEEEKDSIIQPIEMGENKFGFICVISQEKIEFSKDEERLLKAACRQIAIAIANATLYVQSITDNLTHLYMRRYFIDRLEKEIRRSKRYDRNLTMLMADLDFFKDKNDTYGHQAGDIILIKIGEIIKDGLRDIDIPCRYGGEEFTILLPETDKKGGITVAERLRKKIESTLFNIGNKNIRMTISIGVATFPQDADTMDKLIEQSDKKLYQAKENGRNKVES